MPSVPPSWAGRKGFQFSTIVPELPEIVMELLAAFVVVEDFEVPPEQAVRASAATVAVAATTPTSGAGRRVKVGISVIPLSDHHGVAVMRGCAAATARPRSEAS